MAAFSTTNNPATDGPGSRPLKTVNLMADRRQGLELDEGLQRGVATAHRGVNYVHLDFRNFRGHLPGSKARV